MTNEDFASPVFHGIPCYSDMYFSHMLTCVAGSIYFLRLSLLYYRVDLCTSLRGGRNGHLLTSLCVANRLRYYNSLRLARSAEIFRDMEEFDYYSFLPCLFNLVLGMHQSWDVSQRG